MPPRSSPATACLTLAFDIVTRDEIHRDANVRLLLTRALARASGIGGMVGGQMLDLAGEGRFGDREPVDVARLQQMKTGALLRYRLHRRRDPRPVHAKRNIRRSTITAARSAKPSRSPTICSTSKAMRRRSASRPAQDAALGKTTFVTQLGIEGAKQRVRDLLARADSALSIFGAKGDVLRAAARFVAERKN